MRVEGCRRRKRWSKSTQALRKNGRPREVSRSVLSSISTNPSSTMSRKKHAGVLELGVVLQFDVADRHEAQDLFAKGTVVGVELVAAQRGQATSANAFS